MTQLKQSNDDHGKTGQLIQSAADIYESFFVPALFGEWPAKIADRLNDGNGKTLLDVGCGTGILARFMAERTGNPSLITGVDINEGMLSVATRQAPEIDWQIAPAEKLPFEDNSFDIVVSQFAMMFFQDRVAAIKEMHRVLKPGGRIAVAVWDSLSNTPGYSAVVDLLQQLFGEEIADNIRTPFVLGNKEKLKSLFESAGMVELDIITLTGTARFNSIDDWIFTDINGWTLAGKLDDKQYEILLRQAREYLKPYTDGQGCVEFPSPAHIVMITKR